MKSAIVKFGEFRKGALLEPPISKSDALRLLSLQYIADDPLAKLDDRTPEDIQVYRQALAELKSDEKEISLHMGLGGAPLRFIIALASVCRGKIIRIDAAQALRERPHEEVIKALKDTLAPLGLEFDNSQWPWTIDTTNLEIPETVEFNVVADSSQYASALMLAAAYLQARRKCKLIRINLASSVASSGYLDLTTEWLENAGVSFNLFDNSYEIVDFQRKHLSHIIPLDWSSIGYLSIWGWLTRASVRIDEYRSHPDVAILRVLRKAGLRCEIEDGVILKVLGKLKDGLEADAENCPDLIPTLAVLALAAPEESAFSNVSILRNKESDRIEFIKEVVEKMGGKMILEDDDLIIEPAENYSDSLSLRAFNDHRRVMSASLLSGLFGCEVQIDDVECVSKSFPDYWHQVSKVGVQLHQ